MATLLKRKSKRTGKLLYSVQVVLGPGERPTVPLGSVTKAQAQQAKGYIESLTSTRRGNFAMPPTTADWLREIDDSLYARLIQVGLCKPRQTTLPASESDVPTLSEFIGAYIAGRAKIKPSTRVHLERCRKLLVDYFGDSRPLIEITPGDADEFREHLGTTLAENTVRRVCGRAKQFFRAAHRKKFIPESPFADMKGTSVTANRSRDFFIDREQAAAVLKACPDAEWKLIFALSRFGGMRCPSEHLELRWGDVNWETKMLTIRSPKTAHHEGHEERVMPLWPELRPYLQAVLDELLADFDPKQQRLSAQPVIRRYRDSNANLRTQLLRITKRAGLTAWPKLFQNLRATRATELEEEYGGKRAAAWMGHSTKVADKHYWQMTKADHERSLEKAEADYALRAANALQQTAVTAESGGNECSAESEKRLDVRISREIRDERMTPTGLEPVLPA